MAFTTIITRYSTVSGTIPNGASFQDGELALNIGVGDGTLYYKVSGSTQMLPIRAGSSSWAANGGGGGGSITVQNQGVPLSTAVTNIDFVGAGVSASLSGSGVIRVSIDVSGSGLTGGQQDRIPVFTSATQVSSSRLITSGTEFIAMPIREFVISGAANPRFVAESPPDAGIPGFIARESFSPNVFGAFFGYDSANNRSVLGSLNGSLSIIPAIRFDRGSNNVELVGSGTIIRGIQYIWPNANGASGSVLTQNGAGVLSWEIPTVISASFAQTSVSSSWAAFALSASWAPPAPGQVVEVRDENVVVTSTLTILNFTGAGVSSSLSGSVVNVIIPGGGGGGTALEIRDEDVPVTASVGVLNFTGAGVTASQSGSVVNVTIPGGGAGALEVRDEGISLTTTASILNFVGPGVTAALSGTVVNIEFSGSVPSLGRGIASVTTPSLAPNQAITGSIATFGKSYVLLTVETSTDSRIRLYGSASFQNSDLTRSIGVDPVTENGLMVDLVLSGAASLYNFALSPVVNGCNIEPTPTALGYYTITNLSAASASITVNFNRVVLEA